MNVSMHLCIHARAASLRSSYIAFIYPPCVLSSFMEMTRRLSPHNLCLLQDIFRSCQCSNRLVIVVRANSQFRPIPLHVFHSLFMDMVRVGGPDGCLCSENGGWLLFKPHPPDCTPVLLVQFQLPIANQYGPFQRWLCRDCKPYSPCVEMTVMLLFQSTRCMR